MNFKFSNVVADWLQLISQLRCGRFKKETHRDLYYKIIVMKSVISSWRKQRTVSGTERRLMISHMWIKTYAQLADIQPCMDYSWCRLGCVLKHWRRYKTADIFQTIFKNSFSWTKTFEFRLKFLGLCLRESDWQEVSFFQVMDWCRISDKQLLVLMVSNISDAIWRHKATIILHKPTSRPARCRILMYHLFRGIWVAIQ